MLLTLRDFVILSVFDYEVLYDNGESMYRLTALWKVRMDRKCFSNVQQTFSGFLPSSNFRKNYLPSSFASTPPPVRIDPPQRSDGVSIVTRLIKTRDGFFLFARINVAANTAWHVRATIKRTTAALYIKLYTPGIYIFIAVIIVIIVTPYARACLSDMQTKRAGRRIVMSARAELMSENNF